MVRESAGHPAARSRGRYPGGPGPARGHSRWPRKSGPCPCSGSACPHREDAGVAWQGLGRCARRKAEAVSIYRLLHRARRSCRGACCPPQRSGSFYLAISGINSKGMANQALEQARDSVLHYGEPVSRERLIGDEPLQPIRLPRARLKTKKPLRRPLLSAHRRGFRSRGSGRSRTDDGMDAPINRFPFEALGESTAAGYTLAAVLDAAMRVACRRCANGPRAFPRSRACRSSPCTERSTDRS